jgi:hypothetical protein
LAAEDHPFQQPLQWELLEFHPTFDFATSPPSPSHHPIPLPMNPTNDRHGLFHMKNGKVPKKSHPLLQKIELPFDATSMPCLQPEHPL